jgi:hypothetical protein
VKEGVNTLGPVAAVQVARIGGELEAVLRTHQTQRRALAWRERAELQSVR